MKSTSLPERNMQDINVGSPHCQERNLANDKATKVEVRVGSKAPSRSAIRLYSSPSVLTPFNKSFQFPVHLAMSLSVKLSVAEQEAIINICEEDEKKRLQPTGIFRRCLLLEPYFIKYNSHVSLYSQYKTQQYVYDKTAGDDSAPREVPKIYDYFIPNSR
jgi:hypothetical protein